MKSKKGFTLIELLAIIVILAIIAVITVPIILNIIEDSQKGAAKDSAYGFKDSINKYYVSELAKDPHFHLEDGTYTVSELNGSAVLTGTDNYTISLSGTVPTSGTITIENNDITGGNIQIGDYCIDLSNMEVTKGSCEDTTIANATPIECFEYEVKKELTVSSVDECVTTLIGIGIFGESDLEIVNTICNGETIGGIDLSQLLSTIKSAASIDLISQFPNVFEAKELDEVEITEYKCGGKVTENEGVKVISYTTGEHMDVVIPNKIDGKNVTSIRLYAFSPLDFLTGDATSEKGVIINSIIIPNSVTNIGESAFEYNRLTSVTIPNSVTSINQDAFRNNQLTSVVIPDSMTSIEQNAFDSNQLTSVVIPSSVTSIGYNSFGSNQLTSVTIPDSVTSIGDNAFRDNQLTNITIPNSVTSIGEYAFYKNQLTSIEIPSSITIIEDSTFSNNKLTNIEIPNSVTSIGESAFYDNQLTSVTIPNSVTTIGESAFENNKLTSVTIPNSVTTIGESAFESNQLTSVTIPNSVTSMGSSVFRDNSNLTINVIGYTSAPSGWDSDWNWNWINYTVNWNYQG